MERLLYPINEEIFKKNVRICFDNINEGFEKFNHEIIENKSEAELIEYIENSYDENGFDNFYVDLYLNRIDISNENKFINMLCEEDRKTYQNIKKEYDNSTVYYKIDRRLIPFITRLSTREILFITIYLTKTNKTIWGNYDMKFPVFYEQ
jgi:hypothetical protein